MLPWNKHRGLTLQQDSVSDASEQLVGIHLMDGKGHVKQGGREGQCPQVVICITDALLPSSQCDDVLSVNNLAASAASPGEVQCD